MAEEMGVEGWCAVALKRTKEKDRMSNGLVIEGLYVANIVQLKDGSLATEAGWQSTDGGRTWESSPSTVRGLGILRLPNGELGAYFNDIHGEDYWKGTGWNRYRFRWSADEGKNWSEGVPISTPGCTMGLNGTMFALRDGRLIIATYSQYLGSRFDKRGGSWGTYKGVRFITETEAHYPQFEVGKVYYSDDNGRTWQPCDGWIIGWRDNKWSDLFTEPCGLELKDGRIMTMGRSDRGRLYQAFSDDRGHSWWPGAKPTQLAASYSPCRIARLPQTGEILIVWNQLSRAEVQKGFRRSRLSSAISKDEGKTWGHFKNIEAIGSLADVSYVPPDPDLTPVWGDEEIGNLPEDFTLFHYPNISVVDEEVFVSYLVSGYKIDTESKGDSVVQSTGGSRTRILPVSWFYS